MKTRQILIWTELLSLSALVIIFFKVLILKPACFDVFDNYFMLLPLFAAKVLELSQLRFIKNE